MNLLGGEQSGKGVDRVGWEQEEGVVDRLQQFAINESMFVTMELKFGNYEKEKKTINHRVSEYCLKPDHNLILTPRIRDSCSCVTEKTG